MQEELLDNFEVSTEETKAIDEFFTAYVIFYSIALFLSFILSLFNAPDNMFINMFFRGLVFLVFAFHVFHFIFLIIRKKGVGRIGLNFLHFFSITVVAIGLIFYFGRLPYGMEMLATSLLTVPFAGVTQLIYELVVRKEPSKFLNIISILGISLLSIGLLFFLKQWPNGMLTLLLGGIITFIMAMIHFNLTLKKEGKYQIHIRYLAQCLFSIVSTIMLLLV